MTAMFQCLEAVEQNDPKLLAQVDTVGVGLVKWPNVLEMFFFVFYFGFDLKASKHNRHW